LHLPNFIKLLILPSPQYSFSMSQKLKHADNLKSMTIVFIDNMAARMDDEEHMLAHASQYKTVALTLEKLAHVVNKLDIPSSDVAIEEDITQPQYSSEEEEYDANKEYISEEINYLIEKLALQELHDEGLHPQLIDAPESIDSG